MSINIDSDNKFLLFIRSKEVEQINSGLNSNMKIDLDAGIGKLNAFQDIHAQLSSCEIPHSFYNVTGSLANNSLSVNGSADLLFTEKHYDIFTLIDDINSGGSGGVSIGLTASFDENKSKVTLANTSGSSMTINFGVSKGFAKLIGFPEEDFVISNSSSREGFNVVNLNTIHSLFVHTNLSLANVLTTTNKNYANILQKIPVNNQFGEVINYNPYLSSQFSSVIQSSEIKSFELSIRDQNNNLINFNNVNFEISILFEIHQKTSQNTIPQFIQPTRRVDRDDRDDRDLQQQPTRRDLRQQLIETNDDLSNPILPIINNTPSVITSTNVGSYSQPIPVQKVVLPITEQNIEDEKLHDKQSNELQNKLIELSILDDI